MTKKNSKHNNQANKNHEQANEGSTASAFSSVAFSAAKAVGMHSLKHEIGKQVKSAKKRARDGFIMLVSAIVGLALLVYGAVELVLAHFSLSEYTNVILGLVLLVVALMVRFRS